jgi:3-oxoacyl-[acyl-carrier protein] reductase
MKKFLVVGGSHGIGASISKELKEKGYSVYSISRTAPDSHFDEYKEWDASTEDSVPLFDIESLDGIAYCPGTINLKPFNRFSTEDFINDYKINVLGAVKVIQAYLPLLKKSGNSSIVLFSTVAVQTGMSYHASIAAAKGGIEGLTRSLAAEFASSKIRVNAIAPSLTNTPLAGNLVSSPEKLEASNKRHPLGRIGETDDLGRMASFLLSPENSWITGQIIGLDGGMALK